MPPLVSWLASAPAASSSARTTAPWPRRAELQERRPDARLVHASGVRAGLQESQHPWAPAAVHHSGVALSSPIARSTLAPASSCACSVAAAGGRGAPRGTGRLPAKPGTCGCAARAAAAGPAPPTSTAEIDAPPGPAAARSGPAGSGASCTRARECGAEWEASGRTQGTNPICHV